MNFWTNAMMIALGVRVTRGRGEACFVSVEFVNEDTEVFFGRFLWLQFPVRCYRTSCQRRAKSRTYRLTPRRAPSSMTALTSPFTSALTTLLLSTPTQTANVYNCTVLYHNPSTLDPATSHCIMPSAHLRHSRTAEASERAANSEEGCSRDTGAE